MVTCRTNLGLLLLDDGAPTEAIGHLQDAAALARKLFDHSLTSQCERALARGLELVGDHQCALSAVSRALEAARSASDTAEQVRGQLFEARLQRAGGQLRAALDALASAQRSFNALPAEVQAQLAVDLADTQSIVVNS